MGEIPPEVDFARRYWAGDWTEGDIGPQITTLPHPFRRATTWTFDYEGRWLVYMAPGTLAYQVEVDGRTIAWVGETSPDHFLVSTPDDAQGYTCWLMPDGEIREVPHDV